MVISCDSDPGTRKNVLIAITNNQGAYLHAFPHYTHGMQCNKNKLEFCGSSYVATKKTQWPCSAQEENPRHHAALCSKLFHSNALSAVSRQKKASS